MHRSVDDLRRRADALFDVVLDEQPRDVGAWLDAACGEDLELRREVEALLQLVERPLAALTGDPLAEVRQQAIDDIDDGDELAPGCLVGRYRVLRELGRGGMGVVYLAERADGEFDRRVALKLIRRGMASAEIQQRFRRERQILASLNHPSIARLLDGGVAADGRSYLAMEYVEGETIDRYCDRLQLPVRHRVELMAEVARAVQHAHGNLVVHRDMKPSNVVVTPEGGVRLLDFGIARLLAADDGDSLTRTGGGPMTPGYASPEQLSGQAVTTASDVYQLGLMLYELLVGRRPGGDIESRAPRPSTAAARGTAESAKLAAARGSTPRALGRELRGDLDMIVLTALRLEPERRYPTAQALADDLEHYLHGLPVAARGDSVGYLAARFARRHRLALAAGVVILGLLVSYAVTITRQARALAQERDRVRAEATKVTQVKDFVVELFQGADPSTPDAGNITACELVERGDRRVQQELADQPEILGELLEVIGVLYSSLGSYEDSVDRLQRAAQLHAQVYGESSREAGDSRLQLADVYREMGEYERAQPLFEQVLAQRRARLGDDHPDVARALDDLGLMYAERGDYERAEASLRQALAILRRTEGMASPKAIQTLSNLGLALKWKGDFDAAEPLLREAYELTRDQRGEHRFDLAWSMDRLGVLLGQRGDYQAAEPLLRDSLEIAIEVLGDDHPDVALMTNNLAKLYSVSGRPGDAEPYLRRALELNRRIFGPEHQRVATNLANLGDVYVHLGDPDRAVPLLQESLKIRRAALGPDHPEVALALHYLAQAQLAGGHTSAARKLYGEAVEKARRLLDPEHPFRADILVGAGEAALAAGRADEAIPLLGEAVAIRRRALVADHPSTRAAEEALATARRQAGIGASRGSEAVAP